MTKLDGQKIAVFDLEIKKSIEQCSKGWQSHDEMGVSVLCIYDYSDGRYRVFDDQNISEALDILTTYDYVVGFNTVSFDWRVIKATYPDLLNSKPALARDYDILREIWKSKGLNPDIFAPATHGGYKLDDVARETIGLTKTGEGGHAPVLYQAGRIAELYDYCIQDVKVEKELFEFVVNYGYVVRSGRVIPLRRPFNV